MLKTGKPDFLGIAVVIDTPTCQQTPCPPSLVMFKYGSLQPLLHKRERRNALLSLYATELFSTST